ncbi:MAG: hypothetical protein K8F34_14265, partial [Candidatus Kuenenia stuttgartiensis]|nr:hypothetical protein [Candidatus Kuenenia stuttgartiensis]
MDRKSLIALIICGVIMLLYYPIILPLLSPKTEKVTQEELSAEKRRLETKNEIRTVIPALLPSQETLREMDIHEEEVVIENECIRT